MSRLLVFTENYARGGGNRYMIDCINALMDSYSEIMLASNAHGIYAEDIARLKRPVTCIILPIMTRSRIFMRSEALPKSIRQCIMLVLLPLEPFFFAYNLWLQFRFVGRYRPDLVLSCNGGYPASQSCLSMVVAAKQWHTKTVMCIVSMPTKRRRIIGVYDAIIDRMVWNSLDRVIVNAAAITQSLHSLRSISPLKVSVVYNGLEDTVPIAKEQKNDAIFTIGCVARLDKMKGIVVLMKAFIMLAKQFPQLRLVLAGEGNASKEVMDMIQQHNLQTRVDQLGHFNGDISELLSRFDVYVFPSLWEGFPYSILEAMRAGSAIIATNVGGIPEAIENEMHGLLITPNSSVSIVHAITRLLMNPELRIALSQQARVRFEREFTLKRMHINIQKTLLHN